MNKHCGNCKDQCGLIDGLLCYQNNYSDWQPKNSSINGNTNIIDQLIEDKSLMKVIDDILYLIADTYNISHSKACELIGQLGIIAKSADLSSISEKE